MAYVLGVIALAYAIPAFGEFLVRLIVKLILSITIITAIVVYDMNVTEYEMRDGTYQISRFFTETTETGYVKYKGNVKNFHTDDIDRVRVTIDVYDCFGDNCRKIDSKSDTALAYAKPGETQGFEGGIHITTKGRGTIRTETHVIAIADRGLL